MARSAGLQVDGRGRLLVFPVSGSAHAAPAQLLEADASDLRLGEAVLAAIARSEPDRDDWEALIAAHESSRAALGDGERDFVGYPSVGFTERRSVIDVDGWEPDRGPSTGTRSRWPPTTRRPSAARRAT
ncbi:MAG TPA: hypothetical protein VE753_07600 [Gaiellaceae bacterium]|jgi:hypothetical protein|nr:hypothetical protein [Gaiellaceae bacterium]